MQFKNWVDMLYLKIFQLVITLIVCCFQNCNLPVLYSDPSDNPYHSEHFTYYYSQKDLSSTQIERIGLRDEQLLKNVNSYLGIGYDRLVEVFISNDDHSPEDRVCERIYETVHEAQNSNGHEIAHVIIDQLWGRSESEVLNGGVTTACETNIEGDAFDNYRSTIVRGDGNGTKYTQVFSRITADLLQIMKSCERNEKNTDSKLIGAFIHFLKVTYGIEKIKVWYQNASADYAGPASDMFSEIFGISLSEVIMRNFNNALVNNM